MKGNLSAKGSMKKKKQEAGNIEIQRKKEAQERTATEAMIVQEHDLQGISLHNDLYQKKHVLEMESLNEKGRIRPMIIKDQNSYSVSKT